MEGFQLVTVPGMPLVILLKVELFYLSPEVILSSIIHSCHSNKKKHINGKKYCSRTLKSSQFSTVITDAFFPFNQEVTGRRSLQYERGFVIKTLFGGKSVTYDVLLQG